MNDVFIEIIVNCVLFMFIAMIAFGIGALFGTPHLWSLILTLFVYFKFTN